MIEPTAVYVYKEIDGCRLKADVYGGVGDALRPAIVYLHGGALITGSRNGLRQAQLARWLEDGYVVASVDYRLAPESKLPDILQDMQDAFTWVRQQGLALFRADPARVAALGHSAGGYLSLLAGASVAPKPSVVISYFGYGDIIGPWMSEPDPFYCTRPSVPSERAMAAVRPSAFLDDNGDEERGYFYLYCRQQGQWPQAVLGIDPAVAPEAFYPFCPERNVTPDYPPTLLLHGDADTDVPYALSVSMSAALTQAGVPHELVTIRGGAHGFDYYDDDPQAIAANEKAYEYLRRYLKR